MRSVAGEELPVNARLGPFANWIDGDGDGEALGEAEALGFRDAPLSSPAASRAILIASAVTAFSELFASPFGFALCGSRGESACTRTLTRLTLNRRYRATAPPAMSRSTNDHPTSLRFQFPRFLVSNSFAGLSTGSLVS